MTLAELSVRPLVARDERERAARQVHVQQAEADFDTLPFDRASARAFGRVAASLRRSGRKTSARAYDALIAGLSDFLRDPEGSPEPLRRFADRDPAKASKVFSGMLKRKRGFSWNADGEELLRQNKPRYFDGTVLPRTVPLSGPLSSAYKRAHQERA